MDRRRAAAWRSWKETRDPVGLPFTIVGNLRKRGQTFAVSLRVGDNTVVDGPRSTRVSAQPRSKHKTITTEEKMSRSYLEGPSVKEIYFPRRTSQVVGRDNDGVRRVSKPVTARVGSISRSISRRNLVAGRGKIQRRLWESSF